MRNVDEAEQGNKGNLPQWGNIPDDLKELPRWVAYKLVWDEKKGNYNKPPHSLCGKRKQSYGIHYTFDEVRKAVDAGRVDGVGFAMTEQDNFICIDLDGESLADIPKGVLSIADHSYAELSPSGNGLHVWFRGDKPKGAGGKQNRYTNDEKYKVECFYDTGFLTVTGNKYNDFSIMENQMMLDFIYNTTSHSSKEEAAPISAEIPIPQEEMEDALIVKKLFNSEKNKALFSGDTSVHNNDHSAADMALCNSLAFYTKCNAEQMDRIFRTTGLIRDKWDVVHHSSGETYGEGTIKQAITLVYPKINKTSNGVCVKNSTSINLQEALQDRYFEELEKMHQEWELNGSKGRKPTTISPVRCAVILPGYISFILFDFEENTRLAMYQPDEGIYTRNTTLIKRVISWIAPKLNSSKADEVIYHLINRSQVKKETASRYLIPVKNGIFNLKTKKLEPFSPQYVFTTKISTEYRESPSLPIIDGWDVEAWISSIACGDAEIIRLLWQVMNDSLNGNYSRRKAIFLVGEGNNGKGTFQELITNLIGFKNIATLKVNEFEERFRLGLIEGKTAIIGDDVPANVYIDDSSNFNSIVTGDTVLVELKNKHPYSAVFRCTVIQSTNGMPKFRNKTTGTIRRIIIVPFNADFNGQVENFKIKDEYIRDEKVLQYVLHKAINLDFERFDIPKASTNELEVFRQDNDPVLDFKLSVFDEWNIPEVPKYIVYEFYKRFCDDNGYKHLPDRSFQKQFSGYLEKKWQDSSNRFDYEYLKIYLPNLNGPDFNIRNPKTPDRTYKDTACV